MGSSSLNTTRLILAPLTGPNIGYGRILRRSPNSGALEKGSVIRNERPDQKLGDVVRGKRNEGNGGDKEPNGRWLLLTLLSASAAAAVISSCIFDTSGLPWENVDGGPPDGGNDGGTDGEVDASDADILDGGPDADAKIIDDTPTIIPPQKQVLHNDGVLIKWNAPQEIPPGKTQVGYEILLSTNEGMTWSTPVFTTHRFYPLDIAQPNTSYWVRVRAVYSGTNGNEPSDNYSELVFTTIDTLAARYEMTENSGTMIGDSSGHGYHGILTDCDPLTAWDQSGVIFDGQGCYINTGSVGDFDSNQPFTMVARRVNRFANGIYHALFTKYDARIVSQVNGYWYGFNSSDQLQFALVHNWQLNDQLIIRSTNTFTDPNSQYNLAVTYDGFQNASSIALYKDGLQEATTIYVDALSNTGSISNAAPSRVGADIPYGGMIQDSHNAMYGIIGGMVIFSDTLDATDIHESYCYGKGLEVYSPIQTATDVPADCMN